MFISMQINSKDTFCKNEKNKKREIYVSLIKIEEKLIRKIEKETKKQRTRNNERKGNEKKEKSKK